MNAMENFARTPCPKTTFVISYTEETETVKLIKDSLAVSGEAFNENVAKIRKNLFFGKVTEQHTIAFATSDRTRISNLLRLIGEKEGREVYSVILP